eukprot:scpid66282/ scgid18958/ Legumain; Asparaginyl endopeptidase; Protease, cysteine 1
MRYFALLSLFSLAALVAGSPVEPDAEGKHWAVLVAGSSGYYNYRHQADVCHAYQILHKHGIPDERIIVFMMDDIAESNENPTKGILINKLNGTDVYHGVVKDYTGEQVTPENFLNVITGNKEAMAGKGSGKVLESGPNDHVFINFVDHGAPGFVAFPRGTLSAKELNSALEKMHTKKMYKQLVFYMEACESGSMFEGDLLPKNRDIFATTAANAHESSYACYYDKLRRTFLGDVYSVKWMEDTDKVGTTEDLQTQFLSVKEETKSSHVMEFGDMKFNTEQIQEFLGGVQGSAIDKQLRRITAPAAIKDYCADKVASPNVPLAILYNRLMDATTEQEKTELRIALSDELSLRNQIADVTAKIVEGANNSDQDMTSEILSTKTQPRDFDCAEAAVHAYSSSCFDVSQVDFAFRQVYALVNMCENENFSKTSILSAIGSVCKS